MDEMTTEQMVQNILKVCFGLTHAERNMIAARLRELTAENERLKFAEHEASNLNQQIGTLLAENERLRPVVEAAQAWRKAYPAAWTSDSFSEPARSLFTVLDAYNAAAPTPPPVAPSQPVPAPVDPQAAGLVERVETLCSRMLTAWAILLTGLDSAPFTEGVEHIENALKGQ